MTEVLNILIIDDDEVDRMAIRRALQAAHIAAEVSEAISAAEGIGRLKKGKFDCALLDYRLPDCDGLTTISDIRRAGIDVPMIVLTGQGSERLAVELMKAGASDYLVKGELSLEHLAQSIRSAVRVYRAERAVSEAQLQLEQQQKEMLNREKQLRAQAEAANIAKDRFLATLSHELRTPLMPVLSLVEVLEREDSLPPEARESLQVIRRNVEMEARLIDDLLDMTRAIQGTFQLHPEVAHAPDLLRRAAEIWQADTSGRQLTWNLDLTASRPLVQADPGRLQQIFWNLIRNAVKYTPSGGKITLRVENPTPEILVVHVIDTGIGIESDSLERIFTAFERGKTAMAHRAGGLGLGLAISRSLVEAHGGQLEAFSDGYHKGAEFRVTLPTISAQPQPGRSQSSRAAHPPSPTGSMPDKKSEANILLVDDHPDTIRAMKRLLQKMGYQVQTADSVTSALQTAREQPFDLLISDIGLPDGTGLDLMQQIRKIQPLQGIALSGYGTDEDIHNSHQAGFIDHLTKPINFKRLEQLIHEALAAKAGETAGAASTTSTTPANKEHNRVH